MKKLLALLLALVMVFSLVACGTTDDEDSNSDSDVINENVDTDIEEEDGTVWGLTPFEEKQTLRIGFFTGSPLSYPFLFADNLGVFEALNIELEYTCFTGGPAMMEANAEWDIASCGLGGLCNGLYGYDFSLIDITDYEENLAIFVRPDSELAADPTNPELWKGVTAVYPAGTTAQAVLADYLASIGLSLSDIESVNADNSNALTVFDAGTGDVLACWNAIALSAEDYGYVRVSDSGQQGYPAPCGTFVHPDFLEENRELVVTAIAVFHLAVEWCYESEDNMAQAAAWYLEHCDEEGFLCTEDVAQRTMEWYAGPTVDEYIAIFSDTSTDYAGLYTTRDLLQAEQDILVGLDFFISEGKYTNEDRTRYLDDCRVDPSVAQGVAELLGK